MYRKETAKFGVSGQHPVIILYDNDSGASKIKKVVWGGGWKSADNECFFREVLLRAEDFRPKAA